MPQEATRHMRRPLPAPDRKRGAANETQQAILEQGNNDHESAERDGAHMLPMHKRVLKKLRVVANVEANWRLQFIGDALRGRICIEHNKV